MQWAQNRLGRDLRSAVRPAGEHSAAHGERLRLPPFSFGATVHGAGGKPHAPPRNSQFLGQLKDVEGAAAVQDVGEVRGCFNAVQPPAWGDAPESLPDWDAFVQPDFEFDQRIAW